MQTRWIAGACAMTAALAAGAAHADPLEFDYRGRAVVGGGVSNASNAPGAQPIVARIEASFSAETIFQNGVRVGAVVGGAAERDHPNNDGRGGLAGSCPPGAADCAAIGALALRGTISGFAGADARERESPRAEVEQAYLYVESGWGEASIGRDRGAAYRFSLPTPSVLSGLHNADGTLSITGLGGAVTQNDLSGASTKITLATPRILGLRAGLSYAPESDGRTLEQGYPSAGAAVFDPSEIIEAGLSYSRTWRGFGDLRTEAALTYLTAEDEEGRAAFDRLTSWHGGVRVGSGPWEVGAAYLTSDNGWAAGDRGYEALAVSGTYDLGVWDAMLEATSASDNLVHTDVKTVLAAFRREVTDRVDLSLGASYQERTAPLAVAGGPRSEIDQSATGVFLEIAADL